MRRSHSSSGKKGERGTSSGFLIWKGVEQEGWRASPSKNSQAKRGERTSLGGGTRGGLRGTVASWGGRETIWVNLLMPFIRTHNNVVIMNEEGRGRYTQIAEKKRYRKLSHRHKQRERNGS